MDKKVITLSLDDYHNLVDALNLLNLELAQLRCHTRLTGRRMSGIYAALGRVDSIIASCGGNLVIAT